MKKESEKLEKQVKEINRRIDELEKMLSRALKPLLDVGKTTQNYLKLTGILLENGGLTPDLIIPEIKDPISKEIVRVLIEIGRASCRERVCHRV